MMGGARAAASAAVAAAAATPASTAAPAWSAALTRAIERNAATPAARYLQLATVRPDGRPAVRTVVFRGLRPLPGGGGGARTNPALAIVTDGRTSKMSDLASQPAAEAAWYFPDSREQFRLGGQVTVVGSGCADPALAATRADVWAGLSPGVREWHVHPAPGSERVAGAGAAGASGPAAQVLQAGGSRAATTTPTTPAPPPPPPHDHFTLLLLDVDAVDHVDLVADTRSVWQRDGRGEWSVREVWP